MNLGLHGYEIRRDSNVEREQKVKRSFFRIYFLMNVN